MYEPDVGSYRRPGNLPDLLTLLEQRPASVLAGGTDLVLMRAEGMIDRGWGRIINISSVNGSRGAFGQTNYAAAKAGIHGFTKALALECAAKGVTVNTISPGYLATRMTRDIPREIMQERILPQIPLGRLGRPEEVAALVAFLCGEDAAYITGANLAVNGGLHMQ